MPTARPTPGPVGYLVNRKYGLATVQPIGFDYVLGAGGLYVQSESANLTARVLAARCKVRGLTSLTEKVELAHGPIPAHLFEIGLRWFQDDPHTERFFPCAGTATATGWWSPNRRGWPLSSSKRRPLESSPSSTPTEAPAPSFRRPTTRTSRASESTVSSDASVAPNRR